MKTTRGIYRATALSIALSLAIGGPTASGQARAPRQRAVLIQGGTIFTAGPDGTIQEGTLVLRRGKIAAVRRGSGRRGRPSAGITRIDAEGLFVTPGLIDAWTDAGTVTGGRGVSGRAAGRAIDLFDVYDRHVLEAALRGGVTAICLEPGARRGFVGRSALVRLANPDAALEATTEDVCLLARVGLGKVGPFARLKEIASLRSVLREAKTYRETWEDYEEELEEYVKGLKSGKTVKLGEKKEKKARKSPRRGRRPPAGRRRRGRRPRPRPRPRDASAETRPDVMNDPGESPDGGGLAFAQDDKKKKDSDEKKKGGLTKPERPTRDLDKEVLVKVLKRELPVRFEAHRPADIVNILELVRTFNLDAAIIGASGGRYVAKDLAEAEVPVILGPMIGSALWGKGHARDLSPENAARLDAAGVSIVIASGRGTKTRYLAQIAAVAVGHGLSREAALRAITIGAAKVCGVADRLGSLEVGKRADVVVWSGHPFEAGSVVEYVFVDGQEVYHRE